MPVDASDADATPYVFVYILPMYSRKDLPFYSCCDGPRRLSRCNHAFSFLFLNALILDFLAEGNDSFETR